MVGIIVIVIKDRVTIARDITKGIIMDIVRVIITNFIEDTEGLIISMDLT